MEWINVIFEFIKTQGWPEGVLTVLILFVFYLNYRLYILRIKDHKEQIDRLAKENHEYRDIFTKLLDDKFGISSNNLE